MSSRHLIHKLESGDVEARREAARTLAQYPAQPDIMERDERDISDAIGPLAVAFFDRDAEVRKHAARAIGAAHGDRQDISVAMPALVRGMADRRDDVRRSAVLILRDAVVKGWDATPYASQIGARLTDPVNEVKWGAADALAYHFAAGKRWQEVAGLLGHADPDVAQETAGTLVEFFFRFDYRPVIPELVALLATASLELRLVAAKAVAHRPRDASDLAAAFPVLLDALGSEQAGIRKRAVQALGVGISRFFRHHPQIREQDHLGPAGRENFAPVFGALPAIEDALSDPESGVQDAAIETLNTFLTALPVSELDRYRGMMNRFKKRLRSRHKRVKQKAAEALTRQWARAGRWDDLLTVLTRRPKVVKRQVLNTLAGDETIRELGFAPLLPAVLDMLSDPDGDLSYAAQRALERVDAGELLAPLTSRPIDTQAHRALLKQVRSKVYRESLDPLQHELEGKSAAGKMAFLTGHLDHPQCAVRAWAAESLRGIGPSADISIAIPPLTRLLDDPDPATRREAANTLGDAARYGTIGEAHERLAQLAADESAEVRKMAFRALEMSAGSGRDLGAVLPAVCEILRADPDRENRGEAAVIISTASRSCDLGAFVPDLAAALEDGFRRVRFYIARALHYAAEGGTDIRQALPALTRALEDERTVASWAAAALVLYAADADRAAELLEATRALDGHRRQVARVVKACEKQITRDGGN